MRSSSAMPAADVALGDRHDEPQVRLGELPLGQLAVALRRPGGSAAVGCRRAARSASSASSVSRREQPGLDALRERDLLLGREQRDLADLLEVHPDRVEAAALSVCVGRVRRRTARARRRRSSYDGAGVAATRRAGDADSDDARRRAARAAPCVRALRTGAALVFELQLLGDLVDDLDAARLEHVPRDRASSSVSGSRSGNAAKISPVVMKPRSLNLRRARRRPRRSAAVAAGRAAGAGVSRLRAQPSSVIVTACSRAAPSTR